MTARQQIRTGSAATAPETWTIETQRAPHVGEILQTARERKGIDLVRAERETKIRARHLVALESPPPQFRTEEYAIRKSSVRRVVDP